MPQFQRQIFVNAQLIDPRGRQTHGGLLVEGETIKAVGSDVTILNVGQEAQVVECWGHCLAPGIIDMQAFAGEPGFGYRESFSSISRAAAAGGVTTVVSQPNTHPPLDDPAVVDYVLRLARDKSLVRLLPMGALTKHLEGREIVEIGLLQQAGALAFSNAEHSIKNAMVMRNAMTYARDFNALVVHFSHDEELAGDGVMNEGAYASHLGLSGIPVQAETVVLARDLQLVALTGARYHASLISSSQSLQLIAAAKAADLPVSCGVSIHHLTLNEYDIGDYRSFLKILPPLRSEADRLALVEALALGLIDVVVSNHNPQDVEVKRLPFAEAAFGAIGIETLLPAALRLVHNGDIDLPSLFARLCLKPAEILNLPQGRLEPGAPADLVLFDPNEPFVLDAATLASKCKNTPFDGARFQGRVLRTHVAGRCVYDYNANNCSNFMASV